MKPINWRKGRFLLLLLLLVGCGVALSYFGSHRWGHLAEEIGKALIIAGVLGLTVDGYVKAQMLDEASKDTSKYLIGYRLPREIQDTINDLMSTKRISRNLHLHYKLTSSRELPDKVLAEITLTYDKENISNAPQDYEQYFYQHSSFSPCFLELRCDSNDKNGIYHFGPKELNQQVEAQQGKMLTRVTGKKIQLQPRGNPGEFKYQFSARCTVVFPQDYSDVFIFDYPSICVFVTAEFPDNEFEFHGPKEVPDNFNRWDFPRLFLGGEQITVHWRRKRA